MNNFLTLINLITFFRVSLLTAFIKLETVEPFQRKILPDEIWIYRWDNEEFKEFIILILMICRYPVTPSFVPVTILWPLVTLVCNHSSSPTRKIWIITCWLKISLRMINFNYNFHEIYLLKIVAWNEINNFFRRFQHFFSS